MKEAPINLAEICGILGGLLVAGEGLLIPLDLLAKNAIEGWRYNYITGDAKTDLVLAAAMFTGGMITTVLCARRIENSFPSKPPAGKI